MNSEVWHSLTAKQVEHLEEIDKQYLRRLLNSHSKVAIECLFLETGLLPYKYEVIMRRGMYWWKLVHTDQSELIRRVYESQIINSCQGDWIRLLEGDKKLLGINLTDEDVLKMSRNLFKKMFRSKVEQAALIDMNALKQKHSKSTFLNSSSLKTSEYLQDGRFSKAETQLLFKLRTQTTDLKMNFPKMYSNTICSTCKLFPESQSHILQCPVIVPQLKLIMNKPSEFNEECIYGKLEDQLKIIKIYTKIFEVREDLLKKETEEV